MVTDGGDDTIRLGISSCLLGAEVRFNGGHKLDRFLRDTLGAYVEFVPVCPEFELGLGVPRETLRLVRPPPGKTGLRLVAPKSGSDHTRAMRAYARRKFAELVDLELMGFIVQKGSPSCGMERVRVYPEASGGSPTRDGQGLFTAELQRRFPNLPVEEDGRLKDPVLRDNFIVRIFAYRRLRALFRGRWTAGDVVRFHTREKMLLMAHDPQRYRALGRRVARVKDTARAEFKREYTAEFLTTLSRRATRRKNTDVLQHMCGHFKKVLDDHDRHELLDLVESYRLGLVPLVVPITLMRHHVRKRGVDYLQGQTYLDPHPRELMLRNHV